MALRSVSRWDDYEFPAGAFDVRGWEVRSEVDDGKVGKVDDILLDPAGRFRYLDVDLGLFQKHVLVPLEAAHVADDAEVVWVERLSADAVGAIPEFHGEPEVVTDDYMRRLDVAWRDAAGQGEPADAGRVAERTPRTGDELPLARLSALGDYRVSGESDPRGWKVLAADGRVIGEATELLVDTTELRAAYVICDVDEGRLELEQVDRHVLLPVDRVRLDRRHKHVVVDGLLPRDVAVYPAYTGLPLTRSAAREVEKAFRRAHRAGEAPDAETHSHRRPDVAGAGPERHFFGEAVARDDGIVESAASEGEVDRQVVSEGETAVLRGEEEEVRIRISGGDIIIEKRRTD